MVIGVKLKYIELLDLIELKGCKLLTTEEQYNINKDKYKKIDIISSCGHESKQIILNTFKYYNTGVLCKNCFLEKSKKFNKNNCKFSTFDIENDAYKIIKNACPSMDISNTNDGCLIDIIIKPKDKDLWLPFQLKSTTKCNFGIYCFRINNKIYDNMLILLVSINENKIWIINNNLVNGKGSLSIGINKSKYSQYEIQLNEFENKILEYYDKYSNYLISKENAVIPITDKCKTEHEYKLLRHEKITFLNFEYPEKNQQVYDFIVNGYKIQEKTASIRNDRKNSLITVFYRCSGNYIKDDNHYYWVNFPDKNHFLILPQEFLLNKDNKIKRSISIKLPVNKIFLPYLYSYSEVNVQKINELFSL